MKFRWIVLVALLAGAQTSYADRGGGDPDQQSLSAREIQHYFAPYLPAVRDCYAANAFGLAVDGTLRIELVIQPDGFIGKFGFVAAGVTGDWLRRLDACLRPLSETWHFPVRHGATTAVLPFALRR